MPARKTYADIQAKLDAGTAVVMTARELCDRVRAGDEVSVEDVDVVTTGTKGLMSGSTAILHFRVAEPKRFKRARELYLNEIPCTVGPCPNETLGRVDTIVFATTHSLDQPKTYGGGHLLRDIVENKPIAVRVVTEAGAEFTTETRLDEMELAKYFSTRTMFQNYLAFVNASPAPISSIFSSQPLQPNMEYVTYCGCGEINPLQKDPEMRTIGVGTRILVNGAPGVIVSRGTRSVPEKPNIMAIADMKKMNPHYMGGYHTPEGPEVVVTMAAPIPILDEAVLAACKVTDAQVPLVITDVNGRVPVAEVTYGDVWHDNFKVTLNKSHCRDCGCAEDCPVVTHCPTKCFSFVGGRPAWDKTRCVNCGSCVNFCVNGAFECDLGAVRVGDRTVPVFCRLSDRACAHEIMDVLKRQILAGEFRITEPIAPLFD